VSQPQSLQQRRFNQQSVEETVVPTHKAVYQGVSVTTTAGSQLSAAENEYNTSPIDDRSPRSGASPRAAAPPARQVRTVRPNAPVVASTVAKPGGIYKTGGRVRAPTGTKNNLTNVEYAKARRMGEEKAVAKPKAVPQRGGRNYVAENSAPRRSDFLKDQPISPTTKRVSPMSVRKPMVQAPVVEPLRSKSAGGGGGSVGGYASRHHQQKQQKHTPPGLLPDALDAMLEAHVPLQRAKQQQQRGGTGLQQQDNSLFGDDTPRSTTDTLDNFGYMGDTSEFEAAELRANKLTASVGPPVTQHQEQQQQQAGRRNAKPKGYKPYTLKEYKETKPQKYMELGKLAPDLMTDELIAARAKAERMKAFGNNMNKNNIRGMKVIKPVDRLKQEEEKRLREKEVSKAQLAREYAENVKRPAVKKDKRPAVAMSRKKKEEEMATNGQYGDFEGSLYDEEGEGFQGAAGLQAPSGNTRRAAAEKAEKWDETGVDQEELMRLDAENESARLQIERMKAEFGL
jgi:hypothetical protein